MLRRTLISALATVAAFTALPLHAQHAAPVAAAQEQRSDAATVEQRQPVTVLVSIDGFRPDYLDRGMTPNLNRLRAEGVFAHMRPSFPSKTFPNHFTIVTGLRPDRNGVVGNSMIDPRRPGQTFSLSDTRQSLDEFWWNEANPIWVTAEKAGVRTATMFWPGSEVAHGEGRPADWLRYDQNISNLQRVRMLIDWLRRPADIRPKFATLYFDTVDTAGHRFGITSNEVNTAMAEVDQRIGELMAGAAELGQPLNLIVVSDHGMGAVSQDRTIQLNDIIDPASMIVVESGPYAAIEPAAGTDNRVYDAFLKPHEHMQCYRKENLPARLHYGQNPRVAAIICLADPGWVTISGTPRYPVSGGNHGWDPQWADMDALFLANGPAFRQGATLPTFDNVNVYPLMARLLGVTAEANDGDVRTLEPALAAPRSRR